MLLLALVVLALYLASGLFLGLTSSPPVSALQNNLWHRTNLIADLAPQPEEDDQDWPLFV